MNHSWKIELSAYEIANLLNALKMVPRNGAWYASIVCKMQTAIEESGLTKEDLEPPNHLSTNDVRRHLNIIELREKHKIH